jgi:chromate transporter
VNGVARLARIGRTGRRWILGVVLAVIVVLAWLDLERPDGVYGWTFVAVTMVAVAAGVHWARRLAAAPAGERPAPEAAGSVGRWALFREALALGFTGFGGGLAVLSQIEQRLVERRRWIPIRRFLEIAAIAQGLPGAVATNALALIGFERAGVGGALVATVSFVLPSFLMLFVAALLYPVLRNFAAVDGIFRGLNPAVTGLVLLTALRLGGRVVLTPEGKPGGWWSFWNDRWSFAVMAGAALAVALAQIGVVEVVAIAGFLGVVRTTLRRLPDPAAAFETRWRWFRRRVADAARLGARTLGRPWWRRLHDQGEDDLLGLAPLAIVALMSFAPSIERLAALGGLATVFLRAGAVTFGGGFAMVPLLESELVRVHGWLTPQEFADAVALGQVTPGPVVITATFVGYRVAGILGALVATASVFAPAWLVAIAAGGSFRRMRSSPAVQAFLNGIQPAVVGLMFAAAFAMGRSGIRDWPGVVLAVASLAVLWRWKLSPGPVLLGAAVIGLGWRLVWP